MKTPQTYVARASAALVQTGLLALTALLAFPGVFAGAERARNERLAPRDFRAQAEQYIDYSSSIHLTAEQERLKAKALDQIPAPCCKDYTTRTCCCPCNLTKSIWGLSDSLIAKKGYTAPQVQRAVTDWLALVNPKGFTGNACFTGGCKRPFAKNGCGGMDATQVILGDDVR